MYRHQLWSQIYFTACYLFIIIYLEVKQSIKKAGSNSLVTIRASLFLSPPLVEERARSVCEYGRLLKLLLLKGRLKGALYKKRRRVKVRDDYEFGGKSLGVVFLSFSLFLLFFHLFIWQCHFLVGNLWLFVFALFFSMPVDASKCALSVNFMCPKLLFLSYKRNTLHNQHPILCLDDCHLQFVPDLKILGVVFDEKLFLIWNISKLISVDTPTDGNIFWHYLGHIRTYFFRTSPSLHRKATHLWC